MLLLTFLLISGRIVSVFTGKENGNIGDRSSGNGGGRGGNGGTAVTAVNPNRANVEVVLYESDNNGDYTTRTYQLVGDFSPAGVKISAEGEILQVFEVSLIIIMKCCLHKLQYCITKFQKKFCITMAVSKHNYARFTCYK